MATLPSNGLWRQDNIGDRFGNLQRSCSLDLSHEQGKIKISPRLFVNIDSTDDADLLTPFAFVYNDVLSKWHCGAGAVMFVGGDSANEAFTQDAATDAPSFTTTARPDLAYFNEKTYGMAAELYRLDSDGTDWDVITSLGGSLNGAPLISFGGTGRLYYRIGADQMGSINTAETPVAPTNTYALDLNDANHPISCGRASSDYIWLGTKPSQGDKARVHQWDGSSTAVSGTYEIEADAVLAMTIRNNVPWIMDSNGVLSAFTGGSFVPVARLPFRRTKIPHTTTGAHTVYLIHYNGMVTDGDRILMNINATYADGTMDENVPSGIWEYNDVNGLFHHASYGLTQSGDTITDYGALRISTIGALALAKSRATDSNANFLAGAGIFSNATTQLFVIAHDDRNDTKQKAGSFITPKIFSPNVTDVWNTVMIRFRKLRNATDKIVIKGRNTDDDPVEATITYTSTTTFTVPTASFTTAPAVGDEVEIINGVGAGRTAHITTITTSAPNYAITLDETITGATTQTAKALFQTWKKLGVYNAQTDEIFKVPVGLSHSAWVQFKVWFLCTGENEIFDTILTQKPNEIIN